MSELFNQIFSSGLMPHGYCIQWRPGLLWLHVLSDALIALAYYAIPLGLYGLIRKRADLPLSGLLRLAAAFILACGTMHLLSIWTIWRPDYGIEGVVKAATAGISLVSAVVFLRAAPGILRAPSMRDLERRFDEQTAALSRATTELRQGDEQRAESVLRLRSIFETAVNPILTIDERGTVGSINPAGERLFGYSADEVIGSNVSMLMDSPDRERHDAYIQRYLETGERRIIGAGREVSGLTKAGRRIPLHLSVSEFQTASGRRFTGMLTDLSERKGVEDRLALSIGELARANRALEERNGELDDFAHTVSHDLKEPLRGIQTYCWTLDEDFGDQLPPDARTSIARIQTLANRMHGMIESVLEYSRLGRGGRARKLDLNQSVQEAVDMLHVALDERGCEVRIPRPFPEAEADPVTVVESLKNLISNASKYNDKPQKWVEVGWQRGMDDAITLYVRDNGIGMSESDQRSIFRIFHRLHRNEDYGEGAGAGLAIVKKLIERQGGRIWVESTPGEGSTFRFTLGSGGGRSS